MSTDTALTDTSGTVDHEPRDPEHEAHDVSDKQYIVIAFLLAVLTAAEVAVSYLDTGALMVPLLLVMMAVKFLTIVGYFMHLKFDNRLFGVMFYTGLALAVVLFSIVFATFHFFTS